MHTICIGESGSHFIKCTNKRGPIVDMVDKSNVYICINVIWPSFSLYFDTLETKRKLVLVHALLLFI